MEINHRWSKHQLGPFITGLYWALYNNEAKDSYLIIVQLITEIASKTYFNILFIYNYFQLELC